MRKIIFFVIFLSIGNAFSKNNSQSYVDMTGNWIVGFNVQDKNGNATFGETLYTAVMTNHPRMGDFYFKLPQATNGAEYFKGNIIDGVLAIKSFSTGTYSCRGKFDKETDLFTSTSCTIQVPSPSYPNIKSISINFARDVVVLNKSQENPTTEGRNISVMPTDKVFIKDYKSIPNTIGLIILFKPKSLEDHTTTVEDLNRGACYLNQYRLIIGGIYEKFDALCYKTVAEGEKFANRVYNNYLVNASNNTPDKTVYATDWYDRGNYLERRILIK